MGKEDRICPWCAHFPFFFESILSPKNPVARITGPNDHIYIQVTFLQSQNLARPHMLRGVRSEKPCKQDNNLVMPTFPPVSKPWQVVFLRSQKMMLVMSSVDDHTSSPMHCPKSSIKSLVRPALVHWLQETLVQNLQTPSSSVSVKSACNHVAILTLFETKDDSQGHQPWAVNCDDHMTI